MARGPRQGRSAQCHYLGQDRTTARGAQRARRPVRDRDVPQARQREQKSANLLARSQARGRSFPAPAPLWPRREGSAPTRGIQLHTTPYICDLRACRLCHHRHLPWGPQGPQAESAQSTSKKNRACLSGAGGRGAAFESAQNSGCSRTLAQQLSGHFEPRRSSTMYCIIA
jgi:hypothetical protein